MAENKLLGVFIFSVILLAIMLLAPQTISLLKGGFNEPLVLKQFQFYEVAGIGFLLGILLLFGIELIIKKGDARYGNSLGFYAKGDSPSIPIFKRFTYPQIFMLSLIFFSILGTVSFLLKPQSFTGVATLPQQFTATDSIIFSSLLIPIAENLGLMFVIALFLVMLRFLSRKLNLTKTTFITLAFTLVLIGGLFGVAWHSSVYSDSETSLIIVFIFWSLGAFITILSGSFIPFWVMHLMNNLFIDLSRFFSNELIFGMAGAGIITLIIAYFIIYNGRLLGNK